MWEPITTAAKDGTAIPDTSLRSVLIAIEAGEIQVEGSVEDDELRYIEGIALSREVASRFLRTRYAENTVEWEAEPASILRCFRVDDCEYRQRFYFTEYAVIV